MKRVKSEPAPEWVVAPSAIDSYGMQSLDFEDVTDGGTGAPKRVRHNGRSSAGASAGPAAGVKQGTHTQPCTPQCSVIALVAAFDASGLFWFLV